METYWVNEEGLRPSQRVPDPLAETSAHTVGFFARSLHLRAAGSAISTRFLGVSERSGDDFVEE